MYSIDDLYIFVDIKVMFILVKYNVNVLILCCLTAYMLPKLCNYIAKVI